MTKLTLEEFLELLGDYTLGYGPESPAQAEKQEGDRCDYIDDSFNLSAFVRALNKRMWIE